LSLREQTYRSPLHHAAEREAELEVVTALLHVCSEAAAKADRVCGQAAIGL